MKNDNLETCWTMVGRAVDGDHDAYNQFAHTYLGVVRGFLANRWQGTPAISHLEDAVQEVFLDMFRANGALTRFQPERAKSFRSFLFGVVYKVALRQEERLAGERKRRKNAPAEIDEIESSDPTLSQAFDREWAKSILTRARQRHEATAKSAGEDAVRRVELLKLRFGEGMPIRDIAKLWEVDAARVHHDYARARDEFKHALRTEVAFHHNGTAADIESECMQLLDLLQ